MSSFITRICHQTAAQQANSQTCISLVPSALASSQPPTVWCTALQAGEDIIIYMEQSSIQHSKEMKPSNVTGNLWNAQEWLRSNHYHRQQLRQKLTHSRAQKYRYYSKDTSNSHLQLGRHNLPDFMQARDCTWAWLSTWEPLERQYAIKWQYFTEFLLLFATALTVNN